MKRVLITILTSVTLLLGTSAVASAEGLESQHPQLPGFAGAATANILTSAQVVASNRYAALGDSVAAGAGLPPMPNSTAEDLQCARSDQAYPHLVAAAKGYDLAHIACSGATAGNLFAKQNDLSPQLDAAFAPGTPKLISVTAGANDLSWSTLLQKCFVSTCGTNSDQITTDTALTLLRFKLHIALISIALRSYGTPPAVVLTGYYNPLSAQCVNLQLGLTMDEFNWISKEDQALNDTIQQVSSAYPFAKFAPVNFTGHDVCSPDSWVQGPSDPAPFHPTATGQAVIAQSVLSKL